MANEATTNANDTKGETMYYTAILDGISSTAITEWRPIDAQYLSAACRNAVESSRELSTGEWVAVSTEPSTAGLLAAKSSVSSRWTLYNEGIDQM